jgi:NADH-quinone oxidoreductase subunit M
VNPKLFDISDLDYREVVIFIPLIVGALALGVYPQAVFNFTEASVLRVVDVWRVATGG